MWGKQLMKLLNLKAKKMVLMKFCCTTRDALSLDDPINRRNPNQWFDS